MANNKTNKNSKPAIKPKGSSTNKNTKTTINPKGSSSNKNPKPLVNKNPKTSRPSIATSRPISYQGSDSTLPNLDKSEQKAKQMSQKNKKAQSKKKPIKKKPKSKAKKVVKWIFLSLLFLFLAVVVAGAGYIFAVIKTVPPLDIKSITSLTEPSKIYDKDEVFMDTLHSDVNRTVVSFDKIPQYLKDAYVSIEDERFYEHNGIDIKRILGSIYTDVKKILTKQSGMHGGSTLTQQLLKNTVLTDEDNIIERKIKEIYLALQLENYLSKDQILLQYLNTIPLGGTTYGVEAASNYYFAKSVDKLNLIESAYMAGITQAPTYYMAYNKKNKDHPEVYINRTKTVLSKMLELGKISQKEYDQAIKDLDSGKLKFSQKTITYNLKYEWYINPTIAEIKKDLKEKYRYTDQEISKLLANGGLKIYTNMDREIQDYTQQVLDETKIYQENEPLINNSKTPAFQASATIVDYKTGNVVALVGGRGTHAAQSTNRAYSELRSVGSSTKPLTVYGPAINEKIFTAATPINDAPIPEEIGKKYSNPPYNPQNDDRSYSGIITFREALKQSKNVCSVLIEDKIGLDTGITYGEKLGLIYNKAQTGISTLALGQFYNDPKNPDGGNTYILASAFGTFGNNGIYTKPRLYSKVVDGTGKVILESSPVQTEVFSKQTAFIMFDLLQGSRSYTGPSAQWGNMPVAGKTGTTTDSKDLWFSGVTPYYSGSVWLGYYDSSTSLNQLGLNSNTAAAVWGKIMSKVHEGLEVKNIEQPDGIIRSEVCIDSASQYGFKSNSEYRYEKVPTKACRYDNKTFWEYFIEGTEPSTYCNAQHKNIQINENKEDNDITDEEDDDDVTDEDEKDDDITYEDDFENEQDKNNKPNNNI
ncbi:MAG: transglycosylase domain-containing protein [Clostridium sp.]|nr:transglycosylase domain-containing protein [Clostridium sp.]